jgi:hypothetical protein
MIPRAEFVRVARSFVRTPYCHQGRMPGVQLDCVGVPVCAARITGAKPAGFEITGYPHDPDGTMLVICREHMAEKPLRQLEDGDVLVISNGERPRHMGVAFHIGARLFIVHAVADGGAGKHRGEVREHRVVWGPRFQFAAAFQVPGVG